MSGTRRKLLSAQEAWEALLEHMPGHSVVLLIANPRDATTTRLISTCEHTETVAILKALFASQEGRIDVSEAFH